MVAPFVDFAALKLLLFEDLQTRALGREKPKERLIYGRKHEP